MNGKLAATAIIFIFLNFYSCGSKQPVLLQAGEIEYELSVETEQTIEIVEITRAQRIMDALLEVYPDRIEKVEFRNDDWALLLRNTWYYYAEGRLLPEDKRENIANYRPISFYPYPAQLPPWTERTSEETERFRSMTNNRRQITTRRSSYFLDDLWESSTQRQTESKLARITFFGRQIRVHQLIQEPLAQVETQIRTIARTDTEVQTWVNSIGTVEGWHWRNIADTQNRSYHSYGLAVDILPNARAMGTRQTYWLWTSQYREDWWNVSYNERYHPPAAVISTFEAHGFAWGGKWALFDTMHFEYRPEILVLSNLR